MAEVNSKHSRNKSSNHSNKKDSMSSKSRRSNHGESSKFRHLTSKTPPLPLSTKVSTLERLLNERETLKMELEKFDKNSANELKSRSDSNKSMKRKHSRDDKSEESKRYRSQKSRETSKHEASPELEHAQVDSEDEETIIEMRRQNRKKLLEKLTVKDKSSNNKKEELSEDSNTGECKTNSLSMAPAILNITKQSTDMFADMDEFESKNLSYNVKQNNNESNLSLTDNWDDAEGYYNIRIGDVLNNRYTVKGLLGQGVFANVIRAQDNIDGNDYVAIKIVRNNDLMYKTSLKEIAILKELNNADPDDKYHCVQFLGNFMHKGHLCLLLESLHMDLRGVIKKYGKNHGLNMKALISYSRQLLLALRLLKKVGIIHADVKPDNILVNEKKNRLKLCDFGSASKISENEPTPYLVSRFYRAPEIILGLPYGLSVDVWSAACTIYEMATGKIMFTGSSNNKMLKCFMDLKGKFPSKLIKRGKFKDQHFNYNNNFLLHKKDEFTGREKVVELSVNANRDLAKELSKSYKNVSSEDEKKVTQLKDLLDKMTNLDASQRLSATDCLKHPFIQEELTRNSYKS